jgi:hypothetical protein
MNINDWIWFIVQINIQQWRFFYGRMSIKSRLERLLVTSPNEYQPENEINISDKIKSFKEELFRLSEI